MQKQTIHITTEDDARIAANTQIISNNHDPYNRDIITCKPVVIKKGAWVGADSFILPGVTIGNDAQHKDDRRKPHHGPLHPQAMQHVFVDVAVVDLQIKGKAAVFSFSKCFLSGCSAFREVSI